MKAVIVQAKYGPAALIHDRPKPQMREGYVLVKVIAAALNPADNIYMDYGIAEAGNLLGCDYAGVIEELGPGVKRDFKKGDRICGCARGGDASQPENGTFAEYIMVKADIALHIPDNLSFEEAATTGVTILTTGRCFYQKFGIPPPSKPSGNQGQIFVYGGSSAMGTMVIQFAKLSNFEITTTCSTRNFALVKSYGADHLFDYNNPKAVELIKSHTHGTMKLCVDCISTDSSAAFCAAILAPGAIYSSIGMSHCPRDDVKTVQTIGYSFLGEPWEQMGHNFSASKEDFEYSVAFAELSEKLLAQGRITPHPVSLRKGGLAAIPEALSDLKAQKVSGEKIVVRVG